ncbi:23330_t:CDS:2, partial [Dentiscutata erythropus]
AYNPLQYSLLFPSKEYGWHSGILRRNEIQIDSEISKIEAEGSGISKQNLQLLEVHQV